MEPRSEQIDPSRFAGRDWIWGAIPVLLVMLTYSPVWRAGFVWDDDVLLTANPVIVGPLGLKEIWTTSQADICPLTLTVFWGEHALWGLAPLPYHLVNLLLFAASAVLLWRVLLVVCGVGAWMGAALWALHPVGVESVAAVCEMKNTLSGFFFLLAVLFFLQWLKAKQNRPYLLTLIFAALAMMSKSSTVVLPLVLCLAAWWVHGRWNWRDLLRLAPFFLMALIAGLLSVHTQTQQMVVWASYPERPWAERLATAGDVIWFYLGKLIWPHPLILMYPRWTVRTGDWQSWIPLLAAIVVFVVLWFNRQGWARAWFFAFVYFLACLLPVIGLMDQVWFGNSFVADHLQYLASMGPLALAGAAISRWIQPAWLRSAICAGLLLILGIVSWQRAVVFGDRTTLWYDTLAKNPAYWPADIHLGFDLMQSGQVQEAIPLFEKALELSPDSAKAHNDLGVALAKTNELDGAIEHFQRAVEIKPDFAEAHCNLAFALGFKGRGDEALVQFQEAVRLDPANATDRVNLGNALLAKGQVPEASAQFEEALKLKPDFAPARAGLDRAKGEPPIPK